MRRVISVVLTFLLSFSLTAGIAAVGIMQGWMNEDRLLQLMSASGYLYEMEDYAKKEITDYLEEKSVPQKVLLRVWDEDEIYRNAVQWSKEAVSKGEINSKNSNKFKEELKKAILEDLNINHVIVTDAIRLDVEQTVTDCGNIYERCMYPTFLKSFHHYLKAAEPWCLRTLLISGVTALVCIVCLWRQYHYKYHAMQYMAAGILGTILSNSIFLFAIVQKNWTDGLKIEPKAYQTLLESFWKEGIITGCVINGIGIFLFAVLCVSIKIIKKNR